MIKDPLFTKDLQELGKTQFDILYGLSRRQTRQIADLCSDITRLDENSEGDRVSDEKFRLAIEEIKNLQAAEALNAKIRQEMILDDVSKLMSLVNRLTSKIEGVVTSAVQKTTSETFAATADAIESIHTAPIQPIKLTATKEPEKSIARKFEPTLWEKIVKAFRFE